MIEVKPEYAGQEKKQQKSYTLYSTKVCIIEKCTVLAAFSQFFLPLSLSAYCDEFEKTLGKKNQLILSFERARATRGAEFKIVQL